MHICACTYAHLYQDEVQVSCEVVKFYLSVPLHRAINVLKYTLNNDKEHLKEHTKLTLTDIHKLTELYLSSVISCMKIIFACFRTVGLLDFHLW